MINARTLARLAGLTLVLGVVGGLIGDGRDVLWVVDDIVWFGFLICALALIVLTVAVLAKSTRGMSAKRSAP